MGKIHHNKYFIAVFNRIVVVIMSFIATILINRALGPTMKGEYAYILNIVSICTVILSFGMGQVYITYRKKYGQDVRNSFVLITLLQCALVALLIFLIKLFNFSSEIIIILSVTLFSIMRSNFSVIAVIDDFRRRNNILLLLQLIYIFLLSVIYITNANNLNTFLLLFTLNELVTSLVIAVVFSFKPGSLLFLKYKVKITEIIKNGFLTMIMALLITFNYSMDIIMLRKMGVALNLVGIYSVSVSLSNMLLLIPDAFKEILFGESIQNDVVKKILKFLKICTGLSVLLILGFLVLGYPFTLFVYGREFVASFPVTLLLFCGSFSMIIYKIIHPLYIADGKQKIVLLILLGSVIINLISNYFIIPSMGIYGAAVSTVFSYTFTGIIFLLLFMKEYKVKFRDLKRWE